VSKAFSKSTNIHPITLLCVDFKLATSCIANRLKPILQNIISQTQKGFLRGRYIGECVRIISGLMDKLEEGDIPGLLMLVDFEKAFDTVKWPFIEKTLEFYSFGRTFRKWIKSFYTDITQLVDNIPLRYSLPFLFFHHNFRKFCLLYKD
jgi:hypothetical protein